nr:GNAT family N-acetyltransferase [uncultured Mediterraneibacter sp.]
MIRKFTENDKAIYLEMAKEFYHSDAVLHPVPDSYLERTMEEALRSDAYVQLYIFESDGEDAGYAMTAKTFSQEIGGYVLWIEEVYIREAFRSKGLGREFFAYVEEQRKSGVSRIRLEVERDNTRAISLYERLGYEVLEYVQMVKDQA